VSPDQIVTVQRQIFNNRLDAFVTGLFLAMVLVILIDCARNWLAILSRRKVPVLCEAEYQPTTYD
jgi:carbon starvation protein